MGKRSPVMPVAALSMCLLVSACTAKKQDGWAEDKQGVLQSLEQQRELSSRNDAATVSLQQQLVMLQSQIMTQESKLNAMEAGQRALDASLNEVAISLQELKAKALSPSRNGALVDMELAKKIEKIEASIKQAKAASAAATVAVKSNEEENAYTAAYLELKSGRYDEAIASFTRFLDVYPEGNFTDQAYFWLGEGYLAQKKHVEAIGSYSLLITTFPDSPKLPAALLKLGLSYESNGQEKKAAEAYRTLLRDHADSDSAASANKQLNALTSKTGN